MLSGEGIWTPSLGPFLDSGVLVELLHSKGTSDSHQRDGGVDCIDRAGLSDLKFRDLTRTAAALLIGRGTSPKVAQERFGHAHLRTILEMYAHGQNRIIR